MKKTLIASAVAAATLSTSAMAMDQATALAERLDSMPEFYGNIQLVNTSVDDDGNEESQFKDNESTLGFKHSHEISDGLTGFMKVEFEFGADNSDDDTAKDDDNSEGLDKLDEAYIGVKGDFGSIQFGSDDTVAEDFDVLDFEEVTGIGTGNLVAMDEGDNLQYRSPEIVDGLTLSFTHKLDSSSSDQVNTSLAAAFEADAFSATLSYAAGRGATEDAFGLGGTFSLDDLTLGLSYESQDDASYLGLGATYVMGANQFALQYGLGDNGADGAAEETVDELWVQALHNLSDNMYVYIEYLMKTTETGGSSEADFDEFAIGAAYSF